MKTEFGTSCIVSSVPRPAPSKKRAPEDGVTQRKLLAVEQLDRVESAKILTLPGVGMAASETDGSSEIKDDELTGRK